MWRNYGLLAPICGWMKSRRSRSRACAPLEVKVVSNGELVLSRRGLIYRFGNDRPGPSLDACCDSLKAHRQFGRAHPDSVLRLEPAQAGFLPLKWTKFSRTCGRHKLLLA